MKQRYGNELHPLYKRWLSMNQRCNNPKSTNYVRYGARGICIDADLKSFEDYRDYVESLPNYDPVGLSIDRIDNDLNYSKGNLRWTSQAIQSTNQCHSSKGFNSYTGVNWSKVHSRWVARVTFNKETLMATTCVTEKEALDLRNKFIRDNKLPHKIQLWTCNDYPERE